MHVHVSINSREEGVAVIDRLGPWLPVLVALSANSPFYSGRDTGSRSKRDRFWVAVAVAVAATIPVDRRRVNP